VSEELSVSVVSCQWEKSSCQCQFVRGGGKRHPLFLLFSEGGSKRTKLDSGIPH
jgi:hypothetical protein